MGKKVIMAHRARAGMVVAADVYTEDYKLIIPQDAVLTEKSIERLAYYSIEEISIYMKEKEEQKISQKPEFSEYENKIRGSEEFKVFSKRFDTEVESLSESFNSIVEGTEKLSEEKLLSGIDAILEKSRNGLHTIDMMHCMREYDDLTYVHSVNVSLLCSVMAEWLGYSKEKQRLVTFAGLMHDIGKLKIPQELIKRPGKLSEEEYKLVKNHTVYGYEILKGCGADKEAALAALSHHERCDGSGYPLGVTAPKIGWCTRIVSVADVYDAMTADRVYRKGICPFCVIETFEKEGMEKYDPHVLLTFLNKTIQAYIGCRVTLSDERQGEVVMINPQALSKPVVRIGDIFVDLSKENNLRIEGVVR